MVASFKTLKLSITQLKSSRSLTAIEYYFYQIDKADRAILYRMTFTFTEVEWHYAN